MLLYPRLSDADGLEILAMMRRASSAELRSMVAYSHHRAAPAPTGGTPIEESRLARLRTEVMGVMGRWATGPSLRRLGVAQFDLDLGRVLLSAMAIVPADAAHDEVWTFLATVVFPDLVALRFPDLHEDRVLGRPRNALRRTWERQAVVGDLQSEAARPLGEDELVGLFERSALSRNRELARALARRVLEYQGTNRSAFARQLYMEARYSTGPLLVDAMSPEQVEEHVGRLVVDA